MELFKFPTFNIDKKIRLIELFAGIGSQAMALRDIGADFEPWVVCEFDRYAVKSYNAIHGTDFLPSDIKNLHGKDLRIENKAEYTYLLTYSFPCTDLSVAGKMKGMSRKAWEEGKSTRSGLLWEVERLLNELPEDQLPDVLLMENVPQVHSEQNKIDFDRWLSFLRKRGYVNHWKDLNARDFGIPQNRERCFMVSILSDDFINFEFPEPVELKTVMKDYLETAVDEKYYINNEKARELIEKLLTDGVLREQRTKNRKTCTQSTEVKILEETREKKLGNIYGFSGGNFSGNVYDENHLYPAFSTMGGGNRQPMIVAMRGRPDDCGNSQRLEPCERGMTNTITTVQKDNLLVENVGNLNPSGRGQNGNVVNSTGLARAITIEKGEGQKICTPEYRIRKLTPRECWRLMGYTDEDFEKAKIANSASQLYKQAGNAIVKQVLMALFSQLNIKGVKTWNEVHK